MDTWRAHPRNVGALALLLGLAAGSPAARAASSDSSRVVAVMTAVSQDRVRPGDSFGVAVLLEIQPGWRISAHAPGRGLLIPTEAQLEADRAVSLEPFRYPAGEPQRLPGADRPMSVWSGTVVLTAEARLDAEAPIEAALMLPGAVSLQACNDRMCLPPATIAFTVLVPMAEPGQPVRPQSAEIFGAREAGR